MANKIIDVSSNNGTIDWTKAASDGVTDVVIRLSLGYNDKDKNAAVYAQGATAAGIRVSYYHLGYPDKKTGTEQGDAKQEANYFTGLFNAGLMPKPNWLAVDLEKMSAGWDTPLTKPEYLQWINVFISEVQAATGKTCLIYSNKYYLDSHLPANHTLGNIPLWIANYNPIATPPLPVGWSKYFMWQYNETGVIQGINHAVDLNKLLYPAVVNDTNIVHTSAV